MHIVELDPWTATEQQLRDWYAAVSAGETRWAPLGLVEPYPTALARARVRRDGATTRHRVAYDGDLPVGRTESWWHTAYDNLHRYDGHAEPVVDDAGEVRVALLRALAEDALALGRTVLGVEAVGGSGTATALAALPAGAARLAMRDQHNVLDLASVSRDHVAALVDDARAHASGYDLVAWDGMTPDEWVEQRVRVATSMNDAPRDDADLEDFVQTADRLRDFEAGQATWATSWVVAARHRASGDLVAYTEVIEAYGFPEKQYQEDTVVVPAHRGHRLGLLVKGVNQLRIMDERPAARAVSTWNAASNDPMVRVNRALGYVCQNIVEEWEAAPAALLAALPVTAEPAGGS